MTYLDELSGFIATFAKLAGHEPQDVRLKACKLLHLELWKASPNATAEDAIDDWNRRCPEEPWIELLQFEE